eukprot:scaffold247538_cov32-Tisochrysis_lutea.AAC.5
MAKDLHERRALSSCPPVRPLRGMPASTPAAGMVTTKGVAPGPAETGKAGRRVASRPRNSSAACITNSTDVAPAAEASEDGGSERDWPKRTSRVKPVKSNQAYGTIASGGTSS